jgi:amidohydrolase
MEQLDIKQNINQVKEELIEWRRYLHQHPELSFQEYHTSDFIYQQLKTFASGLIIKRPTETGVVAYLKGALPGKTILFRADIDALPIQEQTALPFRSKISGVMHACGHDGHTAILLALAKILCRYKKNIQGEVRFVFQPAEEVGGARKMLNTGILDGVDQAFALHIWSPLETGKFGIIYGPAMAAGEAFDVQINGKAGHAGKANETIDPINITVNSIATINQWMNRRIDPIAAKAFSVTYIQSGTNNNVIPATAKFGGTIRTLDRRILLQIKKGIAEILANLCHLYHASYHLHFETDDLPDGALPSLPLVNDKAATDLVERVIKKYLGSHKIVHLSPTLAGEDFAFYSFNVPSSFIFVGTKNTLKGSDQPHHSPYFKMDEDSLAEGLALFLGISKALL